MGDPRDRAVWRERQKRLVVIGDDRAHVEWSVAGVPGCTEDECALYDGKRCRATGFRPSSICEPVVERMAVMLGAEVGRG